MPRRETRHDIERALAQQPARMRIGNVALDKLDTAAIARVQAQLERMRESIDPAKLVRMEQQIRRVLRELGLELRRRRRRPGEGSMPALVEPPRGPTPLAGGAAAPLEFD
jgi:hypothetical protein